LSGDGRRTLAFASRDTPQAKPMATGALATLTQTLQRPRLSLGAFIIAALVIGLGVWGAIHFWPGSHYEASATAKKWYDGGTDALRNGAYYAATKSLEQAVISDDKFPLAHARLAEAFAQLEYSDKAKDELLRVSALVPDRSKLPRSEALYLEAVNATVARDFPSAIRAYSEIARLSSSEPQGYIDLGRAYERNDQTEQALENYLKAISLNPQDATAYLRAGIIYSSKLDAVKARESFDKALELFTALSNVEGQAEVFRQQGVLLKRSGKFPEAGVQFQRELDAARTLGNESQQVTALLDLSGLEYSKGATVQARDYATQAIQFAQQHQLEGLVAEALLHLANSFYGQGNYVEAEKYFKQAIESARAAKYRFREATGLRDLGSLYIQQLRADEGLPLIEQAKNFFQQGNYVKEASFCLTSIGRVKRRKGDHEGAIQAFQQELQIAQQGGDQSQIAFSYGEIASVLYEQERYPEALEQYDKANSINQPIGNRISLAFNRANRGDLLWRLGRYTEAQQAFDEALAIANDPESGYKQLIPEIERTMAQMALSQRHFPEAKTRVERALSLALAGSEYKTVIIEAKYTLGLVQSGSGSDGKTNCQEAIKLATDAGDAALLSRATLALAESALNQRDARSALESATLAQARFAKAGQQESEWRAWLIAALASRQLGERDKAVEQLGHARTVLSQLEQKWGAEAFKVYLTRPDIQVYYKQLS
jgi:tetratricopeptide (TPR) repeat protein